MPPANGVRPVPSAFPVDGLYMGIPRPLRLPVRSAAVGMRISWLAPARLKRHGLFDPTYVARLQDEHERGVANHRKLLWALLVFELWHESFIETPRRIEQQREEIRG